MDKSGVDLSLLDELFMFNSILSEPSNITEGTEKRELIEKMVDKISMDHDGSNYLISVHFKYGIDMKKASLNFKLPELRTLLTINKTRKFSCLLLEVLLHWGLIAKYSSQLFWKLMHGSIARILFLIVLLSGIIHSCSKIDLISPIGFEINIEADSIVFGVIGDFGKAGEQEERVANLVKSWNPDFIITTGDNNYEKGELETIENNISNFYGDFIYNFDAPAEYLCNGNAFEEGLNRFFPSPGNHDANNKDKLRPYLNYFTLPQQETYYKFVWGPVSFYSLNSVDKNIDEQRNWLERQLKLSETPYNIVYFHHSPYSPGQHGNSEKMQWDFYSNHADIVLSGHDHIYSRIEKKGEEGLYYIVNGLGGRSLYNCNSSPLPEDEFDTFCYDANYGAIKATATFNKLLVEFYAVGQPADPIDRIILE